MAGWFSALSKTRDRISQALQSALGQSAKLDEDAAEDLEADLLSADISVPLVQEIIDALESEKTGDTSVRDRVKDVLLAQFEDSGDFSWPLSRETPSTLLMVGVNGAGKTTTCAKLAHRAAVSGSKTLLAAGDTFRAAGSDQLRLWGDRIGVDVIYGETGADASAVAFDALSAAAARDKDLLIIDTAGRMHTKKPLMDELQKTARALSKCQASAPEEVWIVLDASNGQNAISQARFFNETIPLTGAIVTKLDGSSKAGFLLSIHRELKIPIHFVGLGETEEDLVPFDATGFVEALLGEESAVSS